MNTVALIHYDAARKALAEASRIDEVKEIRDQAEALRAYARQRDDVDMERWVAEIKLRATIRIGELSRELETAQKVGRGSKVQLPSSGQSKADTLKAAGISHASAQRAEQLAEPAARKKVEQYIEQQAADEKPVTITQALKAAARSDAPDWERSAKRSDLAFVREYHAVLGRVRRFLRPHGLPYRMLWLSALQDGVEQEIQGLERQDRVRADGDAGLLKLVN